MSFKRRLDTGYPELIVMESPRSDEAFPPNQGGLNAHLMKTRRRRITAEAAGRFRYASDPVPPIQARGRSFQFPKREAPHYGSLP
jgi:hypothetical protein